MLHEKGSKCRLVITSNNKESNKIYSQIQPNPLRLSGNLLLLIILRSHIDILLFKNVVLCIIQYSIYSNKRRRAN